MASQSFSEKLDRFENGSLELAEEFCAGDEFINSKPEEYGVHVERRIATANAAQAETSVVSTLKVLSWGRPSSENSSAGFSLRCSRMTRMLSGSITSMSSAYSMASVSCESEWRSSSLKTPMYDRVPCFSSAASSRLLRTPKHFGSCHCSTGLAKSKPPGFRSKSER